MEIIIGLISLAVTVTLICCAVSGARSLRRIADEVAQLRAIEAARGNNELASIQLANGVDNSVRLMTMPGLASPR
jgi:hypothetical protein